MVSGQSNIAVLPEPSTKLPMTHIDNQLGFLSEGDEVFLRTECRCAIALGVVSNPEAPLESLSLNFEYPSS